MSYTVLARKYRPQKFADVIGQDHVVRTLKNALEQQRIAHGYIFSGHRGIGKTTIARILAMALNCKSSDRPVAEPCGVCDSCREIREGSVGTMDVIEIDAATNRGIEEVRGIIATATAEPARDRFRIFILDEAHQVTDAAFNALLKTLEEPPSWVVFMMCTTQPEDIPQTIRSRCQHFSFHAVRFDEIVLHLKEIAVTEHLQVEDEAIALLAEAGDGSMRDALSIMDQAIACCGTVLTADLVRGLIGNVSTEVLERVMDAVHDNNSEQVLRIVDKLMVEGQSPTHFARQLVRFLRNAVVGKVAGGESQILQISSDEKARVMRIADKFQEEELARFLQIMLRTHGDVSYKQEQRFHLELGLLKMVHAQRLLPLEQLLSSVSLTEAPSATSAPAASPARSAAPSPAASRSSAPSAPFAQRPSGVPPMGGGSGSPFGRPAAPPDKPSPFEADKARKSKPEMSSEPAPAAPESKPAASPFGSAPRSESPFGAGPKPQVSPFAPAAKPAEVPAAPPFSAPKPMGGNMAPPMFGSRPPMGAPSIPPRNVEPAPTTTIEHGAAVAVAVAPPQSKSSGSAVNVEPIRDAVLSALEQKGLNILANKLEEGEWSAEGAQVTVKVAMSPSMIDISFAKDQKNTANQAATQAAGHPMRVVLVSGDPAPQASAAPRQRSTTGVRAQALDEPVVKRMIEKFGAEVRSVIDKSEG